ncbi:MAG TPA: GspMb/PilO family protein [Terriglobales bacterium]|nr:GspMb/PilO family protein [Terriglobales bacterium]
MPDLQPTRKKLTIAFVTLGVLDVAAAAVLFSPLVGSAQGRREQQDQLWTELRQKTHEVEPLRGLDKKVATSRKEIAEFYKQRLPGRDSAVSDALGRVAQQSGVALGQVRYTFKDPEPVGLRPVIIDASLTGDYLQLVKFINSLERDQLFFIVNSVQLGGEQAGTVRLQLQLQTYLKTEG